MTLQEALGDTEFRRREYTNPSFDKVNTCELGQSKHQSAF